jgi:hypothetical protein
MTEPATTEKKNRSWRKLGWGLVAFFILPIIPPFSAIVPVEQTLLLLVPVVAACSIAGWRLGARAALAAVWLTLAIWMLVQPAGPSGTPYDQMARGWSILLAASFGLVSLWNAATPFFVRALAAVAIATGTGFVVALASPSGIARFQHAAGDELTRRTSRVVDMVEANSKTADWQRLVERFPALDTWNEDSESALRAIPEHAANLLPALLALESLAALALGWSIYHRLSPVKLGPQFGPLTEFRFNDQLIWGLAVGLTLCLLPAFAEARNAGLNLLAFFGGLYLIRGVGVLAWLAKGRYAFMIVLGLIPQGLALLGIVALGLGLGDTWLDLRRRPKAT